MARALPNLDHRTYHAWQTWWWSQINFQIFAFTPGQRVGLPAPGERGIPGRKSRKNIWNNESDTADPLPNIYKKNRILENPNAWSKRPGQLFKKISIISKLCRYEKLSIGNFHFIELYWECTEFTQSRVILTVYACACAQLRSYMKSYRTGKTLLTTVEITLQVFRLQCLIPSFS